jgi:hypothetical protein
MESHFVKGTRLRDALVAYLCCFMAVGCPNGAAPPPPPGESNRRNFEEGRRYYEDVLRRLEEKREELETEPPAKHIDTGGEPVGLAEALKEAIEDEGVPFASYKEFVARFEEETGSSWERLREDLDAAYDDYRIEVSLPDSSALKKALEVRRPQVSGPKQAVLDEALRGIATFDKGAEALAAQIKTVKDTTKGLFDEVRDVVSEVEALRDVTDEAEAKKRIERLFDERIPKLMDAVEGLQDKGIKRLVEGANETRGQLIEDYQDLVKILTQVQDFVGDEVREVINNYIEQGKDFLDDVDQIAASVAMAALATESILAICAVSPWLAAAVLAVLAIMALFKGIGGGDGDGDPGSGGGKGGTGDKPSGNGGTSAPGGKHSGDPEDPNGGGVAGRGDGEKNGTGLQGFPETPSGESGSIGSLLTPEKAGVWFRTFLREGEVLFQVQLKMAGDKIAEHKLLLKPIGTPEDQKLVRALLDRIRLSKAGQRQAVNVESVHYDEDKAFPLILRFVGLNADASPVEVKWDSAESFRVGFFKQ